MKRHGRNLLLGVTLLLLFAVSCSSSDVTVGSEQSSAPEKDEIFAAALNTVAPTTVDEGADVQRDGAAATALPESVSLPAVMGDGGEAPALTPEPLLAQAAATPGEPIDSAQAKVAAEAQTSDPQVTTTSLPSSAPTADQQMEKDSLLAQTVTVVTRSEDEAEKAPESTSQATLQAPPVLVTATSMPAVEPPATAALVAEPEHYSGCAARTGGNASIAFPQDLALSGLVLDIGDEIAVFASDGALCAGSAVWTGQNIAITAWADNSQTEAADGLRDGEEMEFRIWDKSTGMEIPVKTVEYGQGGGTFENEGIYVVDALSAE